LWTAGEEKRKKFDRNLSTHSRSCVALARYLFVDGPQKGLWSVITIKRHPHNTSLLTKNHSIKVPYLQVRGKKKSSIASIMASS
jgi:hypothetical protein